MKERELTASPVVSLGMMRALWSSRVRHGVNSVVVGCSPLPIHHSVGVTLTI